MRACICKVEAVWWDNVSTQRIQNEELSANLNLQLLEEELLVHNRYQR